MPKVVHSLILGVVLAVSTFFGIASAAPPNPSTVKPAILTSSDPSCYKQIVYLHGSNPPTTTCFLKTKPLAGQASPDTVEYPCGDMPTPWLWLAADVNFGGAQICFVGTGAANLSDFWITWPFDTWAGDVSAFRSAAVGRLTMGTNGNGYSCHYNYGTNVNWIVSYCGSGWNDAASWFTIDS